MERVWSNEVSCSVIQIEQSRSQALALNNWWRRKALSLNNRGRREALSLSNRGRREALSLKTEDEKGSHLEQLGEERAW